MKVLILNLGKQILRNHTRSKFNAIIIPLEGSIKLFEARIEFSLASHSTCEEVRMQMEEGSILFFILLMDANGCEMQVLTLESRSVVGRGFFN